MPCPDCCSGVCSLCHTPGCQDREAVPFDATAREIANRQAIMLESTRENAERDV